MKNKKELRLFLCHIYISYNRKVEEVFMRVLYGLLFVILSPITVPLGYIWKFVKGRYESGTQTYDWNKRMKQINKK